MVWFLAWRAATAGFNLHSTLPATRGNERTRLSAIVGILRKDYSCNEAN